MSGKCVRLDGASRVQGVSLLDMVSVGRDLLGVDQWGGTFSGALPRCLILLAFVYLGKANGGWNLGFVSLGGVVKGKKVDGSIGVLVV